VALLRTRPRPRHRPDDEPARARLALAQHRPLDGRERLRPRPARAPRGRAQHVDGEQDGRRPGHPVGIGHPPRPAAASPTPCRCSSRSAIWRAGCACSMPCGSSASTCWSSCTDALSARSRRLSFARTPVEGRRNGSVLLSALRGEYRRPHLRNRLTRRSPIRAGWNGTPESVRRLPRRAKRSPSRTFPNNPQYPSHPNYPKADVPRRRPNSRASSPPRTLA